MLLVLVVDRPLVGEHHLHQFVDEIVKDVHVFVLEDHANKLLEELLGFDCFDHFGTVELHRLVE